MLVPATLLTAEGPRHTQGAHTYKQVCTHTHKIIKKSINRVFKKKIVYSEAKHEANGPSNTDTGNSKFQVPTVVTDQGNF